MGFSYSQNTQQALDNLAKAREALKAQRDLALQKKQEAEQVKVKLAEQRKALPQFRTQQNLRSEKFNSMQGRALKGRIVGAEGQIDTATGNVNQYQEQVKSYEGELTKYETEQLKPYEAQVQNVAEQERGLYLAKKFYAKGVPYQFVEGSARGYLKEMYEQGAMNQEAFVRDVAKLQASLPSGEKLVVDYKNMQIKGVESKEFQQSMNVPAYNKRIAEINKSIAQGNSILASNISSLATNKTLESQPTNISITTPQSFIGRAVNKVSNVSESFNNWFASNTGVNRTALAEQRKAEAIKKYGNKTIAPDPFARFILGTDISSGWKTLPEYQTGEKFSLRYGHMWIGRQLVEKNIFGLGEAENKTTDKYPVLKDVAQVVGPIVAEYPTIKFFSPLISTGTSQQLESEYIYDYNTGTYLKKADIANKGLKMTREQALGEFSRADLQRQSDIIKQAFEKGEGGARRLYIDEASLNQDIVRATRFMKESGLDNARIEQVLRNVFPEKFRVNTPVVQSKGMLQPQGIFQPLKPQGRFGLFSDVQTSTMNNLAEVQTGVLLAQGIDMKTQQKSNIVSIFANPQITKTRLKTISVLSFKQPQLTQQKTNLNTLQLYKQIPQQKQREELITLSLLGNLTQQKTTQRQKAPQEERFKPQPEKPEPKKPKGYLFDVLRKIKKKTPEQQNDFFSAFGRRQGKDISLGKYRSQKEAEGVLDRFLRGTLSRSGTILKNNQKIESNLLSSNVYRKSKKDPFRVVQKSEYSLSSYPEKQEIKSSRKKKKSLWGF